MSVESRILSFKEKHLNGKPLSERLGNMLAFIKSIKNTRTEVTSEEISLLQNVIVDEGLKPDSPVNDFYRTFVSTWVEELFSIIVKEKSVEVNPNPEVEVETGYDPEMLKLAKRHPDEYSVDALREDMDESNGSDNESN